MEASLEAVGAMMDHARSRAYALFSRLLLRPIDADTAARLAEIAVLSEAIAGESLDTLAAQHHALFEMGVPPFAGAFLDDEGLIGGAQAAELFEVYRNDGFVARFRDTTADHLGVILGALAFLSGAAADAREDGATAQANDIDQRIRGLLDRHLLPWFPAFAAAAMRDAPGFWRSVVELCLALIAEHRASLGGVVAPTVALVEARPLLDEEKTSIRSIARFITTAAQAGTYLTREEIVGMGRSLQIPRGFGSRTNMLENMLLGAAEYDSFGTALGSLAQILDVHHDDLQALATLHPSLAPWTTLWITRLGETRRLLTDLRVRAEWAQSELCPNEDLRPTEPAAAAAL